MSHTPPNSPVRIPPVPFESENATAEEKRRVLEEQRRSSGNLPDQPPDNPVVDSIPFTRLRRS